MNLLEFYVSLRRELIATMSGVEDARNGLFSWDDTIPNYVTKRKLTEIHQRYVGYAGAFGFLVVGRHRDCGNANHSQSGSHGYVMDSIGGERIEYRDPRFHWEGGQIYQGEKMCKCPCAPENRPTNHHVIEDVLYDARADRKTCQTIEGILDDVDNAIASSGDRHTRSAIREYLLRAVLKINDAILPVPMHDYIAKQLMLARAM